MCVLASRTWAFQAVTLKSGSVQQPAMIKAKILKQKFLYNQFSLSALVKHMVYTCTIELLYCQTIWANAAKNSVNSAFFLNELHESLSVQCVVQGVFLTWNLTSLTLSLYCSLSFACVAKLCGVLCHSNSSPFVEARRSAHRLVMTSWKKQRLATDNISFGFQQRTSWLQKCVQISGERWGYPIFC